MGELVVLNGTDTREILAQLDLTGPVREALVAISAGSVSAPPRMSAHAERGKLSAMPGSALGLLAGKFISVFPGNHGTDVPSHQGCLVLFDEANGTPVAVMDAASVTAARTSATTAVASDVLTDADAEVLTIIGGGTQARAHLTALRGLRPWRQIRVATRRPQALADEMVDLGVELTNDVRAAVEDADLIAGCTSAPEPILAHAWIPPTAHVSSVGGGRELDPATINAADVFVEWTGAAEHVPPAGAQELQGYEAERLVLVGDVIRGAAARRPGRLSVFKSTGHSAEDVLSAREIHRIAAARRLGSWLPW